MFFISGNALTKSRNRLAAKTAKQLLLLKSWKINELKESEQRFLISNKSDNEEED
jgi:hypothetical protein